MFSQRKNKRFNYQSRLQKHQDEKDEDFETKWQKLKQDNNRSSKKLFSLPSLIIMLILLFILMYVLEGYIN